jgi:hypothetical protein
MKRIRRGLALLALSAAGAMCLASGLASAQPTTPTGESPTGGGFFPLREVHRGLTGTAWTVFTGSKPEPMQVEILGVLRGARGPGHDLILAQLRGAKPEYTGVVAGMSGSPVYIGNRLLGALSSRIGQFSKDPIIGITPIAQMLEVRDLPSGGRSGATALATYAASTPASPSDHIQQDANMAGMNFQAMETPLLMSGFRPEAVRLWRQQMAGTSLATVAAGGMGAASAADAEPSSAAIAALMPGSAVSVQLIRGDLEIAATCTVTYIDPKQLLACGHALLQAGSVSLPMTATEVVATLASPLNAFKIVNTGATVGVINEDRDAAIRGALGARARMIPVHIRIHGPGREQRLNVEVVDLPSLTPQTILVALYESLLETNDSTAETSYHLTGKIALEGHLASPVDLWALAGDAGTAPMETALQARERFQQLYTNGTRQGDIRAVDFDVEAIPRHVEVELETARLVTGQAVHAGDTVVVEAVLRPWRQPARNLRIAVKLPSRLREGGLRLLVSDAATLDRTLEQPRLPRHSADLETALAQARQQHAADRIYVSLFMPETQAGMGGQTLSSLPLSVANVLEPLRATQDASLNGESAELEAEAPAGGVLSGFAVLNLRIEAGGGLN